MPILILHIHITLIYTIFAIVALFTIIYTIKSGRIALVSVCSNVTRYTVSYVIIYVMEGEAWKYNVHVSEQSFTTFFCLHEK